MDVTQSKLTRRTFLAATTAAATCGLGGVTPAFAQVNWKKYAGTKLGVNLIKSPRGDNLQKYEKEFTDLTGIQVASEQTPEQQQRQKAVIELSSGSPSFDVIHISYHVQKRQFEKANWLADLSAFMKNPELTEASLTEADFSQAGLLYAKNPQGQMLSLPFSVDYWMVYWNKELFAKKGLSYPQTFDEMVKAAEALTDPKEGTYGFVARGLKNANVPVWTSFLLGYGVDPVDANGNLKTDTPEAIEAARLYQRLLTKSAPQGVSGFNWSECQSAFLQGKVGMWLDGVGFAPPLEDPDKSRVVGKVGYGVMPRGPEGPGLGHVRRRHRRDGREQEQGGGLSVLPVGDLEAHGRTAAAGRRRRAVPPVDPRRSGSPQGREDAAGLDRRGGRIRQDQQARAAGRPAGHGVPRHHRHRPHEPHRGRRSGDRDEEGDGAVQAGPRTQRKGLTPSGPEHAMGVRHGRHR